MNRISSRGQPTRGGPPAWGLGEVLTTPSRENTPVKKYSQHEMLPLETKESGLLPHSVLRGGVFPEGVSRSFKKQKRDILLGTWNVRSLYRVGSLMAAARELARYIFRKSEGVVGTGWSWLRIGMGGGHL